MLRLLRKIKRILHLVTVDSDPFEIAERYRDKGVVIGEGTRIYSNVTFGHSWGGIDPIAIGKDCLLTGCTILGHDASTNHVLGLERSIQKPVIIEDECFIGVGSIVLMGVRVGKGSIVGAGAVVTSDVPPGSVVAGNPARVICTVDYLAEKRRQLAIDHPEYFTDLPDELS